MKILRSLIYLYSIILLAGNASALFARGLESLSLSTTPAVSADYAEPENLPDLKINIGEALPPSSPLRETPATFSFAENIIFDFPERAYPGERVTLDCVVISRDLNLVSAKVVFGQETTAILDRVSPDSMHWQGEFTFPAELPETSYSATLELLSAQNTIYSHAFKYKIEKKIAAVKILGLLNVSRDILETEILSAPGEFLNPLKQQSDLARLFSLGYFSDVTCNITRDSSGNHVVNYIVQENPVLEDIVISGNTVFVAQTILNILETRKGRILKNDILQKDLAAIEELYQDNEFILAKIKDFKKPTFADQSKILYIFIAEGTVGKIAVRGNRNTKDKTILRELSLETGSVFDRAQLQDDLRSVFNLNYFSNVYPELKPRLQSDIVDLTIQVEEKRTNSINFGGGYGQLDGWFGFIDLFLDNLLGEGKSVLLKGQVGQKISSYQFRYHDPWAWPDRTSFTGKIWSTRGYNYLNGILEQRNGWDVEIGKPLSRHIRGSYHVLYEDVFVPTTTSENYKKRGVGFSLAYDTRDYFMNPTKGSHHVLSIDKLFASLGGTVDSWKYSLSLENFFPLEKIDRKKDPEAKVKQVLATRLLGNLAQGDVLESEEYYVGSDNTVRGFSRLFARGRKRLVANLEYRYLFNEMFQGVLFYDLGWADETISDFDNPLRYQTSKGLGLRIITPMGPIRLDWGWKEGATFSEGYLHFSIGHAF